VAPLIGAGLGVRLMGLTKTMTIGALSMSVGHLTMAFEQAFLPSLLLLVIGGDRFISNPPPKLEGFSRHYKARETE
jgi:dipeptide/tripeptide permease